MTLLLIAIAASLAIFLGGLFALRFSDRLHLIIGWSAGALLGVVFFDLIPESVFLVGGLERALFLCASGFVLYMILDRTFFGHGHGREPYQEARRAISAGSISLHSFIDGIAVGLAFNVSASFGVAVAVAVLFHNFSDGINTVNLVLKHGGKAGSALRWVALNAIAPSAGVLVSRFVIMGNQTLGAILAVFAGFFLFIGASDLLPESRHSHSKFWTTSLTVLAMALIYAVTAWLE